MLVRNFGVEAAGRPAALIFSRIALRPMLVEKRSFTLSALQTSAKGFTEIAS